MGPIGFWMLPLTMYRPHIVEPMRAACHRIGAAISPGLPSRSIGAYSRCSAWRQHFRINSARIEGVYSGALIRDLLEDERRDRRIRSVDPAEQPYDQAKWTRAVRPSSLSTRSTSARTQLHARYQRNGETKLPATVPPRRTDSNDCIRKAWRSTPPELSFTAPITKETYDVCSRHECRTHERSSR
jgi:hypothetical protein